MILHVQKECGKILDIAILNRSETLLTQVLINQEISKAVSSVEIKFNRDCQRTETYE